MEPILAGATPTSSFSPSILQGFHLSVNLRVPKCISVTRLTFDTTFIAFKIIEMQTVIRPNIVHLDYAEEALHVCS